MYPHRVTHRQCTALSIGHVTMYRSDVHRPLLHLACSDGTHPLTPPQLVGIPAEGQVSHSDLIARLMPPPSPDPLTAGEGACGHPCRGPGVAL